MVFNERKFYKILMKNIAGKFSVIFVRWYFKTYDI